MNQITRNPKSTPAANKTLGEQWRSYSKNQKIGVVVLAVVAFLLFWYIMNRPSYPTSSNSSQPTTQQQQEEPKKDTSELDASVKFSDSAFQITNNEAKDWVKCKLKLNDDYEYLNATIPANDSLIVAFDSFTKGDGTRFNYFTTAPKNLHIGSCEGDNILRYGYYAVE